MSVDAVQVSVTVVLVLEPTARFVGAVGGFVSGVELVVPVAALLAGETLPAASNATAVYVCVVPGVRPVTVKVRAVVVPTMVVPSRMR